MEGCTGALSCVGNLAYWQRNDTERVKALRARLSDLLSSTQAAAAKNPRFLWVLGAQRMNTPGTGGGWSAAVATYEKGLRLAREARGAPSDPLDPSWGEPELLMSLAGAALRATPPDTAAAERYAKEALALVPYWRSVREGLMARIEKAKGGGRSPATASHR